MSLSKPTVSYLHVLTQHIMPWGTNSPQYVVVHFTGGLADTAAAQLLTYKSYLAAESNAHYLVGAAGIWEMVNPRLFYTRCSVGAACGTKRQCSVKGWGPAAYKGKLSCSHAGIVGHQNSISVEICSGKKGRRICDPMDSGWYFTDDTYAKAVSLVAWICDNWSIKTDHIVMHNQVTGKLCPAMWCNADGAENGFLQFKEDVAYTLGELQPELKSPSPEPDNSGVVVVAEGSYFYAMPSLDSAKVGQALSSQALSYDYEQSGFAQTSQGWVQK